METLILIGELGHLMPQVYASVAYALHQNDFYLALRSATEKMPKAATMCIACAEDEQEIHHAVRHVMRYRMPDTL